jgi:hypothetical protein
LKGRNHLGNLYVDRKIILKCMLKIGYDEVDWIQVVQIRVHRRDLVNTIMKFWVP